MSDFDGVGDVLLADCPARLAVEIVADKWAVVVVYALTRGPRRHGELVELIGGISKKMLTQTLRRLARNGLVEQREGAAARVAAYALTPLGETLVEPIATLTRWAERNGDAVLAAQERWTFDADDERSVA